MAVRVIITHPGSPRREIVGDGLLYGTTDSPEAICVDDAQDQTRLGGGSGRFGALLVASIFLRRRMQLLFAPCRTVLGTANFDRHAPQTLYVLHTRLER